MREKVGKSRNTVFFQDERWKIARRCGAKHISKSKCTKHTRFGPLLAVEMLKKCTPLWREAHFQVKMYKAHQVRTTFGSWDVEKAHAVVARSTFRSQNVQNTPFSDHLWIFWKLRSRKKCTPLWHEAHVEVKMYKTPQCRTTFGSWDVEKVHAVVAQSTFGSQNAQNTTCSRHFWRFRCRKSARRCGAKHILKSKCTKHFSFGRLLEVEMSKKWTPLWREAHLEVKMLKTLGVRTTFGGSDVVSRGRSTRLWILSIVSKTWGFCGISTKDGRHGTFEDDLQRRIFRGRRSTKDMCMRGWEVRVLISWGVTFWSIRSVGLLRWFCMIGAAFRMTWQPVFVAGAIL